MFTGLVEETGRILSFSEAAGAWRLTLSADLVLEDSRVGDSFACNGCCLTAVEIADKMLTFDLLGETVRLTSFQNYKKNGCVNLERSLKVGNRMGGHFVTGHIDALGAVTHFEPRGKDYYLRIQAPTEFMPYLVNKGSVAVDGISLTVAEVDASGFAVWLIPHTVEVTNLHERKPGDAVNLEFDLLAKYVARMLPVKGDSEGG